MAKEVTLSKKLVKDLRDANNDAQLAAAAAQMQQQVAQARQDRVDSIIRTFCELQNLNPDKTRFDLDRELAVEEDNLSEVSVVDTEAVPGQFAPTPG